MQPNTEEQMIIHVLTQACTSPVYDALIDWSIDAWQWHKAMSASPQRDDLTGPTAVWVQASGSQGRRYI